MIQSAKQTALIRLFIFTFVIGCLCFLPMLSTALTTHMDGLWHVQSRYLSDDWELSLGRFVIWIMDRLRFGYAGEPFQSLLTLAFLTGGNVMLLDTFSCTQGPQAYLISAMLQMSSTVCNYLSYRYTAPAFGLAFLLSVLAARLLVGGNGEGRQAMRRTALAAIVIVLTLGAYQADLGCTAVIVVVFLIRMCMDQNTTLPALLKRICHAAAAFLISCGAYKIIWDLILKIGQIETVQYRGTDTVSVGYLLKSLPGSLKTTYLLFWNYYMKVGYTRFSMFQGGVIHIILLLVILALLVCFLVRIFRADVKKGLLAFFLTVCLPPAAGIYRMLSPDAGDISMQMTGPYTVIAPVLLLLFVSGTDGEVFSGTVRRAYVIFLTLLSAFLLYGRIYQTGVDLSVMQDGRDATQTLVSRAVYMAQEKGLYDPEKHVLFVGIPSESAQFRKSALWDDANAYAQYGQFWRGAVSYINSYQGVLYTLGIRWESVTIEEFLETFDRQEITDMPHFPAEGCVTAMEDIVVIKLADR